VASVRFTGVGKRFGDVEAVRALSLEIADGEFMVLVGPSGSGKTTALRMLAGLESITAGEIAIGDRVVNRVAPRERDIAMVFQDYALYPQMSVFDNLAFGLRRRKVPRERIEERVREAAQLLDIGRLLERKPGQLSGGQAQRVALGRALVREPQAFLMDEPLSNLDAKLRTQTRGEIKRVQQEVGTTTVYVTHDQVEAMTMGDRIAVMNDGVLEQVGTPEELYERPANRFVGGFIGSPAMTFFDAAAVSEDGGVRLRGEAVDVLLPAAASEPGDEGGRASGPPRGDVTVGVRPEAARLWNGSAGLVGPLSGTVEYVEALGRETFVGVTVGGARLAVFVEGRAALAVGDSVEFGLVPSALRYFTPDGSAV
jgi:ABC-type sugar transport system ATPase subunit